MKLSENVAQALIGLVVILLIASLAVALALGIPALSEPDAMAGEQPTSIEIRPAASGPTGTFPFAGSTAMPAATTTP